MKFFITLIISTLFSNIVLFAINKPIEENISHNTAMTDEFGNKIAYNIYIPGKTLINGMKTSAKVYSIPVLPESEYSPNIIQIKTATSYKISNGDSKLPKMLSESINGFRIENINAPFERYSTPELSKFDQYGISRIYEVTYSSEMNPYDVCKELMKNPDIEYAVPVFRRYFHDYTPNDPGIPNQWALNKIQAFKSWDISKGDSTVIIAIVDSGVEYTHEDLAANIWYNPKEIPNDNIDNDSNGYIDDFRGWDFVGNVSAGQAASGIYNPDNDPRPGYMHGTHVAGCAAAVGNNGKGVVGSGFKCKIMCLKCGTDQTSGSNIFRGYDAILYAAQMGAQIINCSWGGEGSSPADQDIINTAFDMGSVVVVSAGNSYQNIDYGNSYPAGYDNVLCVGATNSSDKKPSFSNWGYLVTVYGPGENILATIPGNSYNIQSGTSMSSPIVAGICGQVVAAHPDWTPKQIIRQIRSTSDNVINTNLALRPLYYGRVNAYNALHYNNPEISSPDKIPGISVSQILSSGMEVLTDYKPSTFKIQITNYLSKARRLNVKITALQKYVTVSKDKIIIGTLDEMASDTFSLDVRLLESTPWFEGKVDILLEYTSDTYVDYEIIQLPLKLETTNTYSLKYIFPEQDIPLWYSAVCLDYNNMVMVGTRVWGGYGIFYKYGQMYNPVKVAERPLYCVHSYDENTIYAGSGGSVTEIIKSTNGGMNWSSVNVTDITDFVNGIYFFDNSSGVFVGDPLNSKWGVAMTSNSGQSWSRSSKVPDPLSGEAGYAGCTFGIGNLFWFGTNKGRIILTRDRGNNWQSVTIKSGGFIHKIHFIDGETGIAIYTNSQNDQERKIAVTWDGGFKWETDRFNFATSLGVTPFYLYTPSGSSMIIALCQGGEVYSSIDYGKTWQPILSFKFSTASYGAAFGKFGECRIWSGETALSMLEFDYAPDNPKKTLNITPTGTIDYGNVETNKSKTTNVNLKNNGNMNFTVDSAVISLKTGVYSEEFKISFPFTGEIKVDDTKTIRVRFLPLKEGLRQADLKIYSNADVKTITIPLKGTGTNGIESISFVGDTIADFDSVETGKSAEYKVKYKNSGSVIFNVNSAVLEPAGDFKMGEFTGFEISPNQTSEISITFTPSKIGLQESSLKITSDAAEVTIPVKGVGIEPISVEAIRNYIFEIEELSPNPCNDEISAKINSKLSGTMEITLYNSIGQHLQSLSRELQAGNNILRINTSNMLSGAYYIKIKIGNEEITRKFIKQ